MGNSIRVTRALDGNVISGKTPASTQMLKGQIVNIKGSTVTGKASSMDDAIEFQLATGTRGFLLVRDVLNLTEIPLNNLLGIWPASGTQAAGTLADVLSPELAGNNVSALKAQEYEVEGDTDMIVTSAVATTASVGCASGTNPLFTSAAPHGFVVGQKITVSGMATATAANAAWTVATVPSTTTFTVGTGLVAGGSPGTGGTATPTDVLTSSTPVGSELTTLGGKIALRQSGSTQEIFGILRGVLTVADAANTVAGRLLIEVV